jgi:zinc transporter ZupT
MSIWEYVLLFSSVLLGGTAAFWYINRGRMVLKLALSFSGAYLLGITVLHLMPSVFDLPSEQTGFWMLGGFLTQLLLEQFSKGIEHGHIHVHESSHQSFPLALLFGLSLHAFLEGLPLNHFEEFHLHHHGHEHGRIQLLLGIVLHKLPAAFALVSLLILSKYSRTTTLISLFVFASMSPLGAFLAGYLVLDAQQVAYLMSFVIGSFLHISTTILFEADDTHQHRISWQKLGVILFGIALALLADKI